MFHQPEVVLEGTSDSLHFPFTVSLIKVHTVCLPSIYNQQQHGLLYKAVGGAISK